MSRFASYLLFFLCCWQLTFAHAASKQEQFSSKNENGEFSVELGWTNDPFTGSDVLRGFVEFKPNGPEVQPCKGIRAIQIARVQKKAGIELDWTGGQSARNFMRTAADSPGVAPGFFIDHDANECKSSSSCSPYFRDYWANSDESRDGFVSANGEIVSSSLVDYPYGWTEFEQINLETCMRCTDTGKILGCVKWGANWGTYEPRKFLPIEFSEPSATYYKALELFNDYYHNPH